MMRLDRSHSYVRPPSENGVMDRRVIGERSDAVLRTATPGEDVERLVQDMTLFRAG